VCNNRISMVHPILASRVVENLRCGFSLREAAKEAEIHKNTVLRYRRIYEAAHGPIVCPCGKPSREHRGSCRVRFVRSKARQNVVASFQKREKPL
jgi:hypothetical protein